MNDINEQKKNVDYDLNDDYKQRKKKTALVGVGSVLAGAGSGGAIYFANKRRKNKAAVLAKAARATEGAIPIQKLNSSVGSAPVEIIEEAPIETITEAPVDIITNAVSEEPTEFEILDLSDGGSTAVEVSSTTSSVPRSGGGSVSSSKSKEKIVEETVTQKEETKVEEVAEEVKEEVTEVPAQTVTEEVVATTADTTSNIGVATPTGTYNLSLSFDEINNLISKVVVMSNVVNALWKSILNEDIPRIENSWMGTEAWDYINEVKNVSNNIEQIYKALELLTKTYNTVISRTRDTQAQILSSIRTIE